MSNISNLPALKNKKNPFIKTLLTLSLIVSTLTGIHFIKNNVNNQETKSVVQETPQVEAPSKSSKTLYSIVSPDLKNPSMSDLGLTYVGQSDDTVFVRHPLLPESLAPIAIPKDWTPNKLDLVKIKEGDKENLHLYLNLIYPNSPLFKRGIHVEIPSSNGLPKKTQGGWSNENSPREIFNLPNGYKTNGAEQLE
jgi:hypothetical protein